ncbi:glutaminyl-peptide cyclotransferase [Sphingobacterium mizutaii]|uniref:glutaminyl-peptide cyclotransferase n=1 Tax=Sphingobacterium mizutaii TaxID=1010 RepID=UPI00162509AC|nr:glutaminyl-peptide cyclotransferase [Sphingobacterium mizutaii]
MNKKLKLGIQALTILSISFIIGCKTQRNKVEFVNPTNDSKVLKGEKVQVKLKFPDAAVDSVVYSVDGDIFDRKTDTTAAVFDTGPHSYGNKRLSAKVYSGGKEDIAYSEVLVVPPAPKQYAFEVVSTYPHDQGAFTQGLFYENGTLFETTGQLGESTLRKVELATGKVLQKADLAADEFGEGMTVVGNDMYVLTWQNNKGLVYDKNTFKLLKSFDYQNSKEGWGLTYDGEQFIKSDGSNKLYFLDPATLAETGSIAVFDDNGPVEKLNELEFIDGKVYANLYYGDRDEMAIIDPKTGIVEGRINFVGLYSDNRAPYDNEMNGIAYKPDSRTLLVTGKHWTKLFEVRLRER